MIGVYRVYLDGCLVAEQPNIITDQGRVIILRYLAESIGSYAGAIAVGSGSSLATRYNNKLDFELARAEIDLRVPYFSTSTVLFKGTLPSNFVGKVRELGIYPTLNAPANSFNSRVITTFNTDSEVISGGTVNYVNTAAGSTSYEVTAAPSTTQTVSLSYLQSDFSGYLPTDSFALAYFTNDTNIATIKVRMKTDSTNYYEFSFTPAGPVNYYVQDFLKNSATVVGSPAWSNISSIDALVTANSGGSTTVQLDALRVNDNNVYGDYGLVSRSVLGQGITKSVNQVMEVEYSLGFNI